MSDLYNHEKSDVMMDINILTVSSQVESMVVQIRRNDGH
jgi:hypothetical protein